MSDWITFALPKGRIMQDSMALFNKIGITCPEMEGESRKLVFENAADRFRFMAVRAQDVPTYVEYGSADLGVVGKDTLLEQECDLYEPLDLRFGYCRLVVAEPKVLRDGDDPAGWSNIRVATKYPNITERYFAARGGAGRVNQAVRFDRTGATGRSGRAHRRPGLHRRNPARKRPGRGRDDL
jgi:ATP phosphoribosyltransferase